MRFKSWLFVAALASATVAAAPVGGQDLSQPLAQLRAVGPQAQGHAAARKAWREVSQAPAQQLPAVLAGMDGASPLASNWIRAAVDTIAARALNAGQPLPVKALEDFLADKSHAPLARLTAYELIARVDDTARQRLIPDKLDDASMELRHKAVAMAITAAERLQESGQKDAARAAFERAFAASRDLQQAEQIADALEELGERPSLSTHFGFIMRWKLAAPFDNVDKKGFDVPYGPEADASQTTYAGKDGKEVRWVEHTTKDALGLVDLNEALSRYKGAIAYAYTEFISSEERDCELRLGCINANKVWLNGELLISNHVYHAGRGMDQYRGAGRLRKGVNKILVKIAQNEQEEQWAQDWQFQLRVCDELGAGLLSIDRPQLKAADAGALKVDQIGG